MIQKEELISKIMEMADLSNDEKAEIIGSLRKVKKYGLVWEDHPEDAEERLKSAFPVLREVKELAIQSSPFKGDERGSSPNHILIEGDNLEALIALSYTHEGKVDVIYIDPPYNTGNKDFIYNDCIVDSEDGYRHSKWLSFMEKRLRLAKKLLSDKGVIFISIDDNEQANLKLLCDEVFGENNCIAELVWQKRKGGGNDSQFVAVDHEFIFVYKQNISSQDKNWRVPYDEEYLKRYKFEDEKGKYYFDTLSRPGLNNPIIYDVICPDGTIIKNGTWQISKESFEAGLKSGEVTFTKGKAGYTVVHKVRVPVDGRAFRSIITNISNKDGADDMFSIFGNKKAFSNPKPMHLIKQLISLPGYSNALVLDFFAGSGTTLHATMQLNAEDGGHRQCILVTNNENNICRDVTYERNKRVIQGYTTPKGVAVEGLKDNNLRYYTTEFLPRETSFDAKQALMRAAVDMVCIKENIYTEEREFCGMKFKPSLLRYFKESDGRQMLFVFDERVIEHIVPLMRDIAGQIKVYVFSNGAYAYEDEFQELRDKVELCALPEALLQVYNKVLPQKEEEVMI